MTARSASIWDEACAYYSAAANKFVDLVCESGTGLFGHLTLEEVRKEYPDAEEVPFSEAYRRYNDGHRKAPEEITESAYTQAFGCMPPQRVSMGTFMLSELYAGEIAWFYCRLGQRYFRLRDYRTTVAPKLLEQCRAYIAAH